MRLTASGLSRASACPASAVLPRVESDNPDSDRGTAVHSFLERCAEAGREVALSEVADAETKELCVSLDLDRLPIGPGYRSEIAFAYDVLTGKGWEIGKIEHRKYPALQDWQLVGTADVCGRTDGGVMIADWKVGFGHDLHTAPIAENKQLRFLGLAAARAAGVQSATVSIVYLPSQRIESVTLDAFDLAAAAQEFRDLYERVRKVEAAHRAGQTLSVRTGTHCRYCPALQHCPAQRALVADLLASPATIEQQTKALLTAETAPLAYDRLLQIEAVAKSVRAALTAWARENPITTASGNVYGPVAVERESISGEVAFRVLREQHGEQVAHAACELLTSKAAIERALRAVAGKGELAKVKRAALEAIDAAGGVLANESIQVREHRPK